MTFAASATMPERSANAAPNNAPHAAGDRPKRRRSRAIVLTRVDKRTALWRRIAELSALYTAALGGEAALSPLKRMKVGDAAQLKALAEMARGDYLRDGKGSLDDIVRIERKASTAERALGIVERAAQPRSPLAEHFSRPPAREGRP
jgi:hypothetical protein